MEKKPKWIISGVVVIAIVAFLIYSSLKPIETELLAVEAQTVAQTFKEEGVVKAADERPIYSEISGIIEELPVKEGQQLKKGDLLAVIDTKNFTYELEQLQAEKNSLLGQKKMSKEELAQLLAQLKGELKSIEGQEKQTEKTPYEAQVKQQELMLEELERKIELAISDYEKKRLLFENGALSQYELDVALSQVEELENMKLQQEQALKLIEEQLEPLPGTDEYFGGIKSSLQTQIALLEGASGTEQYYNGMQAAIDARMKQLNDNIANGQLRAQTDGVVKKLHVEEGFLATTQQPILTITSPENLEVEVYLLTEDILYVKEGMKVELIQKRRDGDKSFVGTVKSIAPSAEERISALGLTEQRVKVTLSPEEGMTELRPGYALDVSFTIAEEVDKLAVPKSAIFPIETGEAVMTIRGGKATIQEIEKGLETNETVVIEKGLNQGDTIIKNPNQEGIEQGKRIKE